MMWIFAEFLRPTNAVRKSSKISKTNRQQTSLTLSSTFSLFTSLFILVTAHSFCLIPFTLHLSIINFHSSFFVLHSFFSLFSSLSFSFCRKVTNNCVFLRKVEKSLNLFTKILLKISFDKNFEEKQQKSRTKKFNRSEFIYQKFIRENISKCR